MAKNIYSTKGNDVLLNGKVVATAQNADAAIAAAQKAATKVKGTYQAAASSTPRATTPARTTTPVAATPTPAPAAPATSTPVTQPTASPSGTMTVYKLGSSTQIYASDLQAYLRNGWSQSPSSGTPATASPTPTPTPVTPTPTTPAASTTPTTPTPSAGSYTIKAGDTLSAIARANNTTVDAIMRANPQIKDPNVISSGASLSLPGSSAPSGLNTTGLIEAYARRQAGTASATDVANLDYAMSKGWTPPSASGSSQASQTTQQTSAGPQVDSNGNQIIPGLNTVGLNEAYARKVAGTATETDLRNLSYAESKGWKTPSSQVLQEVTDAQRANDIINSEQQADINAKTVSDEPTVRSSVSDIMSYLKDQLQPDATTKPEAPNYEQSLTNLRTEYGVSALETSLTSLQKEQADILARRQARINAAQGETVAMGVIEGRVSEIDRQESERLTQISNDIQNVTNQLNTKLGVISSIMDAKQLDYSTAVQSYDAQMQENVMLFNAAQNIQENLKTDAQRVIDNARSSAQIMVNGFASAGYSFSQLSPAQQTTLRQLGLQSGLGEEFYEKVLSATNEVQKDVLTQIVSDDKAYVTLVYKDGTTATIATGQPRGSNVPAGGSGSGSSTTEDKDYQKFLSDSASLIEKLDAGEISWSTAWDQLHIKYPRASAALIDETLGGGRAYTNDQGQSVDVNGNPVNVNDQGYYGRGTVVRSK